MENGESEMLNDGFMPTMPQQPRDAAGYHSLFTIHHSPRFSPQ